MHEGGAYLIDWKSNWLADDPDETLQKTMKEEGYDLQAQIYKAAAEKFLSRFPSIKLKGVYFYFIRGGRACRAI